MGARDDRLRPLPSRDGGQVHVEGGPRAPMGAAGARPLSSLPRACIQPYARRTSGDSDPPTPVVGRPAAWPACVPAGDARRGSFRLVLRASEVRARVVRAAEARARAGVGAVVGAAEPRTVV